MTDFAYYRTYLQAGLQELEPYLLSNQLFWPVNVSPSLGEPGYPKFTLGGFLFFGLCARTLGKATYQVAAIHSIEADMYRTSLLLSLRSFLAGVYPIAAVRNS